MPTRVLHHALILTLLTALTACASRREAWQPAPGTPPATTAGAGSPTTPPSQPPAVVVAEPRPTAPEPEPTTEPAPEPQPEPTVPEPQPTVPEPQPPEPEPEPEPQPTPAVRPARVVLHSATVDGRPPPGFYVSMFGGAVQEPLDQVRDCYLSRLSEAPDAGGDLGLSLWVSSRRVIRATVVTPLGDETLQTCAVDGIRQLQLPSVAPSGGARVAFTLSFAAGALPSEPSSTIARSRAD